ncbi:nuclear nucleic acid-binding protein C1D-like [Ischnura elegans]|uniref:nuclear nucleic acid-binding protein C1D-like n=1 Tax=Ischnura elegans TaxID=197161 RepID=UPI001ED86ADB|nr:nuclear nucleic acid-binding protein C1D-like [Ischnura elegans]
MSGEETLDADIALRLNEFDQCLEKTGRYIKAICDQGPEFYSSLDLEDKSRHDLFIAYSVNALYWTYLRTLGINPTAHSADGEEEKPHPVTDELNRVRASLSRAKLIAEKRKMARLNQRAAVRFVRGALWTPGQSGGVADQLRELDKGLADKLKSEKSVKQDD